MRINTPQILQMLLIFSGIPKTVWLPNNMAHWAVFVIIKKERMISMRKTLAALSLSFCIMAGLPTMSNASMYDDQVQTIQRMNQNTRQGVKQDEMINSFNHAKSEFEKMKNDSSRDAEQSKADLDARFAKMKEEFANSNQGNTPRQSIENNKLDMSIPQQQGNNTGNVFNNTTQPANPSLGADSSLSNPGAQNYVRRAPTKKGYIEGTQYGSGDKEYDDNLKKVMDETDAKNAEGKDNLLPTEKAGNKNTFTKENVKKFIIATILLFVVMAILYMLGKKKSQ